MGWASTFENIEERRDEAAYFRRAAGVVEMPQPTREPAGHPAKKFRIDWDWLRWSTLKEKEGGFFPTIDSVVWRPGQQPHRGSFNVGTFDKGGSSGAVQLDFHGVPKCDSDARLSARIGPRDFPTLIQAMLLVNEQATLDAIKKALHRSGTSVS